MAHCIAKVATPKWPRALWFDDRRFWIRPPFLQGGLQDGSRGPPQFDTSQKPAGHLSGISKRPSTISRESRQSTSTWPGRAYCFAQPDVEGSSPPLCSSHRLNTERKVLKPTGLVALSPMPVPAVVAPRAATAPSSRPSQRKMPSPRRYRPSDNPRLSCRCRGR